LLFTWHSGTPVVALRADIDALPIHEEEESPFRSQNAHRMHACGHDSHVSDNIALFNGCGRFNLILVLAFATHPLLPLLYLPRSPAFSTNTLSSTNTLNNFTQITMLLGAAKILKAHESSLRGTVKLVFQPAEEGGAGGDVMIREGALEGVNVAFGFHVWPTLVSP
jgi:metal-dependent amidase/aminoacylase/carboxypeptidase family protein